MPTKRKTMNTKEKLNLFTDAIAMILAFGVIVGIFYYYFSSSGASNPKFNNEILKESAKTKHQENCKIQRFEGKSAANIIHGWLKVNPNPLHEGEVGDFEPVALPLNVGKYFDKTGTINDLTIDFK